MIVTTAMMIITTVIILIVMDDNGVRPCMTTVVFLFRLSQDVTLALWPSQTHSQLRG